MLLNRVRRALEKAELGWKQRRVMIFSVTLWMKGECLLCNILAAAGLD
jgi:hypothetical protein